MESYRVIEDKRAWYPLGVTETADGFHFCVDAQGESCALALFRPGKDRPFQKLEFPKDSRLGNVWEMTVKGSDFENVEYCYIVDGEYLPDPYGKSFTGRDKWGSLTQIRKLMKTPLKSAAFDWEDDKGPDIAYENMIVYRLHTRGFTKHISSRVKERGTFSGIIEKIPYMKELGITTVEIMPPNEFLEVIVPVSGDGNPYGKPEPTGKINYWGYGPAYYFAPKASFCAGGEKCPETEFKELVKALHKEGLEIVVELYFNGSESPVFVLDAVRFWAREYHVDGVHLVGYAPVEMIGADPYLSRLKLFAPSWENVPGGKEKHLAEYNEGFQNDMRRLLKGDEDQINALIYRVKRNPKGYGVINYMANTNGFTLMDMVSYDRKHNEANGEDNRDGNDYNFSWNCGQEGPSRKKKIGELRKKQIRNAVLLLMLSQGAPLIMAGDEFGNSKNGNNNSYCQDNDISWLNWELLKSNQDIWQFVKHMIAFRKDHPVFHMGEEPKVLDYKACGCPDMSFHGVKAWRPEFENFRRQLGIMYCGDYGVKENGVKDDYFFVAYNMHWEPHEFALPNLPREMFWRISVNTDDKVRNGIYKESEEPALKDQKKFMVPARSVIVFRGRRKENIN